MKGCSPGEGWLWGWQCCPSCPALGVLVPNTCLPTARHDFDYEEQAERRDSKLREVVVLQTHSHAPSSLDHPTSNSSRAEFHHPQKPPNTSELRSHSSLSQGCPWTVGVGRADSSLSTQP